MNRLFCALLALAACSNSSGAEGTDTGGATSSGTSAGSPSTGAATGETPTSSISGSTTASGSGGSGPGDDDTSISGSTTTSGTSGTSGPGDDDTSISGSTMTSGASGSTGPGPGDECTNFDATENPITEGGRWVQQGGLTGLDWTNVQTANGIAFGTQTGFDGYNDSIALLAGYGPDQRVSATIHFSGRRSDETDTHEVELILRGSYTAHEQHVYECNLGYAGAAGWYSQIIVLDGPIGTFADITQGVSPVPEIKDGDVFSAEIVGDQIRTFINDVEIANATSDVIATGQPGIGFFWRGTENIDDFGFDGFCAYPL